MKKQMSHTQSLNDSLLWKSFKNGDQRAFEMLYKKYFSVLESYGFRLNPDKSLVEDAIHDLFIDLWRRKEFLSDVDNVKFYLFRSVRNRFIRNVQKDIFEDSENIDDFLDCLSSLSIEHESIEKDYTDIKSPLTESPPQRTPMSIKAIPYVTAKKINYTHMKSKAIQKAFNKLSKRQIEAVHLRFFQELSLDETFQIMEIPKQVVKNLLSQSYAILKITLKNSLPFLLFFFHI